MISKITINIDTIPLIKYANIDIDHCYATLKNQGRSLDEQERLDQLERRLESKVLFSILLPSVIKHYFANCL